MFPVFVRCRGGPRRYHCLDLLKNKLFFCCCSECRQETEKGGFLPETWLLLWLPGQRVPGGGF